jgi:hypothetical protein
MSSIVAILDEVFAAIAKQKPMQNKTLKNAKELLRVICKVCLRLKVMVGKRS